MDKSKCSYDSPQRVLKDLRIILDVPEGHDIIDHCRKMVRMLNYLTYPGECDIADQKLGYSARIMVK